MLVCNLAVLFLILFVFNYYNRAYYRKKYKEGIEQAENQNILKSKFLANLSHDLRSPLHAVIGASEILLGKKDLTATNRSYIQIIRNSSKVLLDLVNGILLYSKLEAGKITLASSPYSLEEVIKETSQMMILNLSAKPVDFNLSFDTSYPEIVIGDQIRVEEIIQNILSNAVKFTEKGMISCNISCEPEQETEKVKITCRISDTGPGMSQEQLAKIFEEYATFMDLRSKESTGLGMSIVRQLTGLMGGSVSAESDGYSGTTFIVTIYQDVKETAWCQPVQYQKSDLINRRAKFEAAYVPKVKFRDAKVLIVDDLDVNLQILKQLMARWEILPDVALSGAMAVQMAKEKEYHMIFLDLMMPEMDGYETAAAIKQFSDLPLILLTADASDETQQRCLREGFSDYIRKPIKNAYLESAFMRYIPKENQIPVRAEENENGQFQSEKMLAEQRTLLETAALELQHLYEHLPEYQKDDMEMFLIKVHGIKGFTRQINRLGISRQAEIMEMAAKTENHRFIKENMEDFLLEIKATIADVAEELARMPKREVKRSEETVDELWECLKAAFDGFNLKAAKALVEQLRIRELTGTEQELLRQCELACEEIEYEEGSELLEVYLRKEKSSRIK